MAMTLRLNPEQESALAFLAQTQGISKHEAALRAITDKAARILRSIEIQEYTMQEITRLKADNHVSRY